MLNDLHHSITKKFSTPNDIKINSFMAINFFAKKNNSPCVIRCDKGKFLEHQKSNLDSLEIFKGNNKSIFLFFSHNFITFYLSENSKVLKKNKLV